MANRGFTMDVAIAIDRSEPFTAIYHIHAHAAKQVWSINASCLSVIPTYSTSATSRW
jgi:hypothetical protein